MMRGSLCVWWLYDLDADRVDQTNVQLSMIIAGAMPPRVIATTARHAPLHLVPDHPNAKRMRHGEVDPNLRNPFRGAGVLS